MARRRIIEQPTSRLAIWSLRIALFSLLTTVIAVIVVRSGALEIVPALSTLGGALALAVVAILLAFGAAISIWRDGVGGIGQSFAGLLIGLVLIAYPLYVGVKAYKLPAIYDIPPDPLDPPRFDAIARLRPRDANPVAYAGLYTAEQQRTAYSDIEPDLTNSSAQEAYNAAMQVITKRRWHVVDARPPQGTAPRDALAARAKLGHNPRLPCTEERSSSRWSSDRSSAAHGWWSARSTRRCRRFAPFRRWHGCR